MFFWKQEKGVLTIEATIVLTTMIFFMCFLLNFGYIYRAQNFMMYAVQETGKELSFMSYRYGLEKDNTFQQAALGLMSLLGYESPNTVLMNAWNSKNYVSAVDQCFQAVSGGLNQNYQKQLERYNIASYSITKANVDNANNLDIIVTYTVKLPFPLFGYEKMDLHQEALFQLW